ncbi:MAG: transglycosylase SLT domain-containing protein [Rikenellaceae bacterium]
MKKQTKRVISIVICFGLGLFSSSYFSQSSTEAKTLSNEMKSLKISTDEFKEDLICKTISPYDLMCRELTQETQWDWRLILAMAHTESNFRPDAKSHRGAQGLMQIMPYTAKDLGFDGAELYDPKTSVTISLKLLDKLNSTFRFPENMAQQERLKVILAAYNAGAGFVINARRSAYEDGAAYNNWAVLSGYITQNGTHSETVGYVRKVLKKYNEYLNI